MAHIDPEEARGESARQVMENPIYKEAFQVIEERLISELAQIEIKAERAEYLRQLLAMGRKYRRYLEQTMMSGQLAGMESERKNVWDSFKQRVIG